MRLALCVSHCRTAVPTHTTVHLLVSALARGAQVRVIEAGDFEVDERGHVTARAYVLDGVPPNGDDVARVLATGGAARRTIDAERLDALVLRVNPIDTSVVAMAQLLASRGVLVLNSPFAMLRTTHKSWLATLPVDVPRPRTIVTRSHSTAWTFASRERDGVVVKPARSCGGRGVSLLRGRDEAEFEHRFREAGQAGDGLVVVQGYLPEADQGEKRLLWLDATLVGGYLRRRAPGEFRHNLKLGAEPAPCEVSPNEHAAVALLSPHLAREGVWFAGIDMIGERIIEVNVLNPGGAHFTTMFAGLPVGDLLYESLAARVGGAPSKSAFLRQAPQGH